MKAKIIIGICILLYISHLSFAQDFPPNPPEKEGYRLIFQDEFNGKELDYTKWIPEYLPSWPEDRSVSAVNYQIKEGIIQLVIDKNSPNEFDDDMFITGFMSGSRTGLHKYNENLKANHYIQTEATQLNQYGYYEMRAKMNTGGGVHCAWWLIGFEDDPNQSCEIDIFEILGTDVDRIWSSVHPWKDNTLTYHTEFPWFANKSLADEFHIYGFDWTPDSVIVYVDGIKIMQHAASITYPLIQIISFYDNRKAKDGWTGTYDSAIPYPKTFDIDYVRIYKKIPEGWSAVREEDLQITSIEPAKMKVDQEHVYLRNIDGHITPELFKMPTFVNVHYNDGTTTQQFVKWNPVTPEILQRIKEPEIFQNMVKLGIVILNGKIQGLPESLLKGQEATLIIKTILN